MPPQATATSGEPSSSTDPPHKKSRRQRNRRRHVKKTAEAKLQALTVPPQCTVPCIMCLGTALSPSLQGLYLEPDRCSRCWNCLAGHMCLPLDLHVIPVANRLVAAIEAKIPYNTPTSGEGKASRVRFNKKERHEIYELRLAIRALMEIPESEFVAAFSAAPGGLPAPPGHHAA
ncbi:hypothetical protein EKO27_g7232 [Xylaria grammica]|uniref:Uncharacterized protein n=1 Tax=Xylaria grammica TaxID=363999 RepID=A0A439D097_9PEZI|nr:hypothetical protein EKO27_g7232 [Xylaria grammica]